MWFISTGDVTPKMFGVSDNRWTTAGCDAAALAFVSLVSLFKLKKATCRIYYYNTVC